MLPQTRKKRKKEKRKKKKKLEKTLSPEKDTIIINVIGVTFKVADTVESSANLKIMKHQDIF